MKVTPRDMQKLLPTLSPDSFKRLAKRVCGHLSHKESLDLTVYHQVTMALYEWLAHFDVFDEAKIRRLLNAAEAGLKQMAAEITAGKTPIYRLSIVESRYAIIPGLDKWLDLSFEEELDTLPVYPVTTFTCDVTALYLRMMGWLKKLRSGDEQRPQHHAPTEAVPEDPGRGEGTVSR